MKDYKERMDRAREVKEKAKLVRKKLAEKKQNDTKSEESGGPLAAIAKKYLFQSDPMKMNDKLAHLPEVDDNDPLAAPIEELLKNPKFNGDDEQA